MIISPADKTDGVAHLPIFTERLWRSGRRIGNVKPHPHLKPRE
jgi:hypothetical protein